MSLRMGTRLSLIHIYRDRIEYFQSGIGVVRFLNDPVQPQRDLGGNPVVVGDDNNPGLGSPEPAQEALIVCLAQINGKLPP